MPHLPLAGRVLSSGDEDPADRRRRGLRASPRPGGRFANLKGRSLRLWFLLPLGLALQLAAVSSAGSTWPFVLVLVGFACLFGFAIVNLPVTGFWMIALGLFLNAFALGLNHGMPIRKKALVHPGNNCGVYAALH